PSLSLDPGPGNTAGAEEGRTRLGGAFYIDIRRIRPDPSQPRRNHDAQAQQQLNDSVRRLGVMQPITVRYVADDNIYQIISGERRFLASREAGLTEMPCWVQSPEAQEVLLRQIV